MEGSAVSLYTDESDPVGRENSMIFEWRGVIAAAKTLSRCDEVVSAQLAELVLDIGRGSSSIDEGREYSWKWR